MPFAYQVFWRMTNRGSLLHLILVYDQNGYVLEAYECKDEATARHCRQLLEIRRLVRLLEMQITPSCYNQTKGDCSHHLRTFE